MKLSHCKLAIHTLKREYLLAPLALQRPPVTKNLALLSSSVHVVNTSTLYQKHTVSQDDLNYIPILVESM